MRHCPCVSFVGSIIKRCLAFLRLLLLEDDGPAHHDCRLRVLTAAGEGKRSAGQFIDNLGQTIDCRMWPPGFVEEWTGEGGLVELSKVTTPLTECPALLLRSPFSRAFFRITECCCRWLVQVDVWLLIMTCCALCIRLVSTPGACPTWSFQIVFELQKHAAHYRIMFCIWH